MSRHFAGVILTGGESRRMGADKAFVLLDGRPMVVAVADALWEAGCHPVECQGGDVDRLAGLGLPALADAVAGRGPAAAIAEALERHDAPIAIAACDLGRLDAPTVRAVIAAGQSAPSGVSVASAGGRLHLLSFWHPSALEHLHGADTGGSYADALEKVGAVEVAVGDESVQNFNSPEDL